jgi:hypothetical protein
VAGKFSKESNIFPKQLAARLALAIGCIAGGVSLSGCDGDLNKIACSVLTPGNIRSAFGEYPTGTFPGSGPEDSECNYRYPKSANDPAINVLVACGSQADELKHEYKSQSPQRSDEANSGVKLYGDDGTNTQVVFAQGNSEIVLSLNIGTSKQWNSAIHSAMENAANLRLCPKG